MKKRCNECRFWSEMVARSIGGGAMEALCLTENGPRSSEYTTELMFCDHWKSNHHGAVDAPPGYGEESRAAYEAEESNA